VSNQELGTLLIVCGVVGIVFSVGGLVLYIRSFSKGRRNR